MGGWAKRVTLLLLAFSAACGAKTDDGDNLGLGGAGTAGQQPAAGSGAGAAGTSSGGAGTAGSAGSGSGTAGSAGDQAAGGSGGTPAAGTGGDAGGGAGSGGAGGGGISESCRGFSFDGLVYSPGGEVLPNTCEPFHPTTNNPYAVRCVDAWPWYQTEFPGDQYCILPPDPMKGVQYGVHPQGKQWFDQVSQGDMSGYDNLNTQWVMESGEEEEGNYHTGLTHAALNYYRNYARMRPGSHHMIVSTGTDSSETWGPGSPDGLFGGTGLPGAQRPDENAPKSLGKPAEDDGLYAVLPANAAVTFNMHHFNATDGAILKEAWTNLWYEEHATIQVHGILGLNLAQTATLSVPAGQTKDYHYSWNITQPVRLLTVFGHRHAWTTNFSSWIEKPGGDLEIVYQSFDWFDEPTYRYDSMTMNPTPAPEMRTDGASSGVRMLMAGEKLHFNCHIEFTDERAQSEGAPAPATIGTLRFANQAFNAEMCILFGSTAAVELPTPAADSTPLPDFATLD